MNLLKLVIIIVISVLLGCTTPVKAPQTLPPEARVYKVKPFIIVALEEEDLSKLAANYFNYKVYGFYLAKERTMYVPLSGRTNILTGARLPDMYILGHEVLHLNEVEGFFHK